MGQSSRAEMKFQVGDRVLWWGQVCRVVRVRPSKCGGDDFIHWRSDEDAAAYHASGYARALASHQRVWRRPPPQVLHGRWA